MENKHLETSMKELSLISSSDKVLTVHTVFIGQWSKSVVKKCVLGWTGWPTFSKEIFAKIIHKSFFCNMKWGNTLSLAKIIKKKYREHQFVYDLLYETSFNFLFIFSLSICSWRGCFYSSFTFFTSGLHILSRNQVWYLLGLLANAGSTLPGFLEFFFLKSIQSNGCESLKSWYDSTESIPKYSTPHFLSKDHWLKLKDHTTWGLSYTNFKVFGIFW